MLPVKFFARLDLDQNSSFLDGHYFIISDTKGRNMDFNFTLEQKMIKDSANKFFSKELTKKQEQFLNSWFEKGNISPYLSHNSSMLPALYAHEETKTAGTPNMADSVAIVGLSPTYKLA